jgi:hypothetical protein
MNAVPITPFHVKTLCAQIVDGANALKRHQGVIFRAEHARVTSAAFGQDGGVIFDRQHAWPADLQQDFVVVRNLAFVFPVTHGD